MGRLSLWALLGLAMLALSLQGVLVSADAGPSESECRPYIEKAINELKTGETSESAEAGEGSQEHEASAEDTGGEVSSKEQTDETESAEQQDTESDGTNEDVVVETIEESEERTVEKSSDSDVDHSEEDQPKSTNQDDDDDDDQSEETPKSKEGDAVDDDNDDNQKSEEANNETKSAGDDDDDDDTDDQQADEGKSDEDEEENKASEEEEDDDATKSSDAQEGDESQEEGVATDEESKEDDDKDDDDDDKQTEGSLEEKTEEQSEEEEDQTPDKAANSQEEQGSEGDDQDDDDDDSTADNKSEEDGEDNDEIKSRGKRSLEDTEDKQNESKEDDTETESKEAQDDDDGDNESQDDDKNANDEDDSKENETKEDTTEDDSEEQNKATNQKDDDEDSTEAEDSENSEEESRPEDDLLLEVEIPENLRDRKHIDELLHLDDEFEEQEKASDRVAEIILRDLKRIYENAVKPLETLYKYRDLSNRHFSDPEIFSKPLILFMGPWSGGKSTIINYLTENEYTPNSLRTGAEPSPAYFNIVTYGNETEVLDGTQLAADWTFSGLQKFGQGLEDRLRGLKLPNKLLEKVNIVEIPGILEVRKQVSRLFPFNDACQWFIDRADIIFLVYDPAKLDVGPETEAILDQLKGREYQTRIILNKADIVKPEELLRVQGALIWNISPLMSSAQPPVMFTTSLWSHPYETSAPVRLLQAQERAFLRDIRSAIDKRIENKIASARRFAVRVRNHAKMVDCYLTTYYNHKTLFGNKKRISDEIIQNPQNYHIYEGLSTLTNISRYDLPDPEVYRDFFRLNPLFEFKKLSETCTYFRGCPINKLDVAIAYDLPELVGKYKKMAESALNNLESDEKSKS